MFFFLLGYVLARILFRLAADYSRRRTGRKGGPQMITLELCLKRIVSPKTLCAGCMFSHIVRGHMPGQELVFCGYAFPLREVPFPVKECTDFKSGRKMELELELAEAQDLRALRPRINL